LLQVAEEAVYRRFVQQAGKFSGTLFHLETAMLKQKQRKTAVRKQWENAVALRANASDISYKKGL
jgi:hypothetical protein